jgi:hypothetical protein
MEPKDPGAALRAIQVFDDEGKMELQEGWIEYE